jgi:hypothetical protein
MFELRSRRIAGTLAVAALVAAVSLVPQIATATTQTKFYDITTGSWSTPSPSFVGVADTDMVTLQNDASSTQTFGSAELTLTSTPASAVSVAQSSLPSGWSAKVLTSGTSAVVLLTSQKGADIAPGSQLPVSITVTPVAAGVINVTSEVKQSNNFSGTGNDFILQSGTLDSLTVIALSLRFAQQPSSTIGQSLPNVPYFAYFCNPVSVQTYNGASPVAANGVPITIKFAGNANPGLYFGTAAVPLSGKTVNTNASGLAIFGDCNSGLAATVFGTGFALSASSPAATTPVTSTSFQVLQTCIGTCTTTNNSSTTGTNGTVTAGDGTSGIFQIFTTFGHGVPLNCDSAVTTGSVDPLFVETQTTSGTVSGTVTMVFPKSVVNSIPNNGTPLMPVCAGASERFPANPAYPGSTTDPSIAFQGLLYDCSDATYQSLILDTTTYPVQLCVQSRAKLAGGAEKIVIFANNLSDPSFW